MPEIILQVRGLDEIIERYGRRDVVKRPVMHALEESGKVIQREVTHYPPRPPNSEYRRTGTLGRKVTTELDTSKWEERIGTRLSYAPYVIGEGTQASWMRHWDTIEDVGERELPTIERFFGIALEEIAAALSTGGA